MNELITSIKKSVLSLNQLLEKLEADNVIKLKEDIALSEFIFTDIAAFVMLPLLSDIDSLDKDNVKKYIDVINDCFGFRINSNLFDDYVGQYIKRIDNASSIYPESFNLICNFDNSAQYNNGEFYNNMGVKNPGPIGEFYITLFGALELLASKIFGSGDVIEFLNTAISIMQDRIG